MFLSIVQSYYNYIAGIDDATVDNVQVVKVAHVHDDDDDVDRILDLGRVDDGGDDGVVQCVEIDRVDDDGVVQCVGIDRVDDDDDDGHEKLYENENETNVQSVDDYVQAEVYV